MSAKSGAPAIRLRGVRQNNLKNLDLDLPVGRLIVVTGLSGSGKSSLAFDTLFAEGQRRYIETFSPYVRQFFDRMDKPLADQVEGIPPAIAIEQRNSVKTTRSTVGTMTEICDHMKLLWPYLAQCYCRQCGRPVLKNAPQQIWAMISGAASSPAAESDRPAARPENRERGAAAERALVLREAVPELPLDNALFVTFEVEVSPKLGLETSLDLIVRQGYQRLWWNGRPVRIEEALELLKDAHPERLSIIQDRLKAAPEHRSRFVEACEQAYHFGKGQLTLHWGRDRRSERFSNRFHCAACGLDYREPTPALFSFNHPLGACPTCRGFGRIITIDYHRAIPDPSKTLADGAVKPWQSGQGLECQRDLMQFCRRRGVPTAVPFKALPARQRQWVLEGDPDYGTDAARQWPKAWYGVKGYFHWLESKAYKMHVRVLLSRYRAYRTCPDCQGDRFQPDSLLFKLPIPKPSPRNPPGLMTLADFYRLPIREARKAIDSLAAAHPHTPTRKDPFRLALEEVSSRLEYLDAIGLGYLTLDRPTRTLSGGEIERVNLTTCLGTRLVKTLFVLDEPSVGLHPRDTSRLVRLLQQLRDQGNTVVVVEHEAAVIRAADHVVDLGPGSGERGGQLVFQGSYQKLLACRRSLTGRYLQGANRIEIAPDPPAFPSPTQPRLRLRQATRHNIRNLNLDIPLGRFVCFTGVSGSGKSTLMREILLPLLEERLQTAPDAPENGPSLEDSADPETSHREIQESRVGIVRGWQTLSRIVWVDQSILARTPRSNPLVYCGAFTAIRDLFAQSEPAVQRGLAAGAFSFNSRNGQCERCRGAGFEKIEMQFLSDVFVRCPACLGRRYRDHILEVRISPEIESRKAVGPRKPRRSSPATNERSPSPHTPSPRSWNIADLLDATVDEVIEFLRGFGPSRPAQRALAALNYLQAVGLGYLRAGQPLNTLSGGESQRLRLVRHLAESSEAGRTAAKPILFLLDEPTTGLHFEDVRVLLQVFRKLVAAGHSLIVIEHHLDVIKNADWVIDLGPEAGEEGGKIVAQGPPEAIAACPNSHTGQALRGQFDYPSGSGRSLVSGAQTSATAPTT